jgi:hypothetical protein
LYAAVKFHNCDLEEEMLPPTLAKLRRRLTEKGHQKRTGSEDALLAELEKVDKALNERILEKSIRDSLNETRIVGGPDTCPCCGRAQ